MPARAVGWIVRHVVVSVVTACALVVVVSLILSIFTIVRQTNADALAAADRKAKAVADVKACEQRVANTPAILTILVLLRDLAENQVKSSRQALRIRSADDPLRRVSERSLERIGPKLPFIRRYIRDARAGAPTSADCRALAIKLGVQPKEE